MWATSAGSSGCHNSVTVQQRWQAHRCWRSPQLCNPQCPFVASSVPEMNTRLKPVPASPHQSTRQLVKEMGQLARCWGTGLLPSPFALSPFHFEDTRTVCQNPDTTFAHPSRDRGEAQLLLPGLKGRTTSPMLQDTGSQPTRLMLMPPSLQWGFSCKCEPGLPDNSAVASPKRLALPRWLQCFELYPWIQMKHKWEPLTLYWTFQADTLFSNLLMLDLLREVFTYCPL